MINITGHTVLQELPDTYGMMSLGSIDLSEVESSIHYDEFGKLASISPHLTSISPYIKLEGTANTELFNMVLIKTGSKFIIFTDLDLTPESFLIETEEVKKDILEFLEKEKSLKTFIDLGDLCSIDQGGWIKESWAGINTANNITWTGSPTISGTVTYDTNTGILKYNA